MNGPAGPPRLEPSTSSAQGRAGRGSHRLPSAGGQAEMVFVAVWRSEICAAAAGKEAGEWLSDFLGRTVRLVYLDDPAAAGGSASNWSSART